MPPIPGHDVYLTIDFDLQHAIETALWPEGRAGAAVIMDVHTGELLAAVSKPGYDLNRFSGRDQHRGLRSAAQRSADATLQSLLACRLSAWLDLQDRVVDGGAGEPDRARRPTVATVPRLLSRRQSRLQCWEDKGHGSRCRCCTGSSSRATSTSTRWRGRSAIDRLAATARRLGLGHVTGFDLPEERGLIPDTEYYDTDLRPARLDHDVGGQLHHRPG